MNRTEYLDQLRKLLDGCPREETERFLAYYNEIIDDRMEEGCSEEEACRSFGETEEVAERIRREILSPETEAGEAAEAQTAGENAGKNAEHIRSGTGEAPGKAGSAGTGEAPGTAGSAEKQKGSSRALLILLAVLGFPLWFPLCLAAFAVLLAVLICLWSVVFSFWCVFGSLAASAVVALPASVLHAVSGAGIGSFLIELGAALVCAALAIVLFFFSRLVTKGAAKGTAWIFRGIGRLFTGGKSAPARPEKNVQEKQYRAGGGLVRQLRLELSTAEVTVSASGDGDFHAAYRESDRVSFEIRENDGVLTVREKVNGNFLRAEEYPFFLQIPPAYAGEIGLRVNLGDVTVTGTGTDARLSAELSAGRMQMTDSAFRSLTVRSRLGNVKLSDCRIGQGICELANGRLEADRLAVEKDLELNLSLGDLRLQDSTAGGDVRIENRAGNVTLRNTEVRGSLTAALSLGNADFRLSGDGYYFTQCETSLGTVKASALTGDRVPVRIVNSAGNITVAAGEPS